LEAKLKAVSEPSSPQYGHYYDLNDVNSAFGASKDSEDKVKSWLQQSGATDIVSNGGMVDFTTTVDNANKMLDTDFKVYTNGAKSQIGTTKYSVPDDLADAIDLISPTTYFNNMKAHRALPRNVESTQNDKRQLKTSCEKTISVPISKHKSESFTVIGPDCLKELYNIGDYKADPKSGSTIAFASFLNQSASYSDLAKFEKIYDIPSQNFTVLALINGGVDNQDVVTEMDGEANLDVQNIIGLVDGLPVGEYITGGSPPFIPTLLQPNASENQNEPYLQYYNYLLSQPNSNLPYVISNSYGDEEDGVPPRYAKRVCNSIGMMGLRGRTILESSGDEGVGASCRTNLNTKRAAQFTPTFPGSCPVSRSTAFLSARALELTDTLVHSMSPP
jgi:tripeptidyl-peptidase I